MKDLFVNNSMNLIIRKYDYDSDMQDRVKYGLEIIYLTITKIIVLFGVALIFGLVKETLIFSIFATGLRTFAYGIHAKKSWHCHISSLFAFVLMPYIFTVITIYPFQKIIISILCLISMILFAPADTHKRPLVNKKHRMKLKITSIVMCIIYITLMFVSKNTVLNNLILLAMISQSFAINPVVYKLFDLPYDNYKTYKSGV